MIENISPPIPGGLACRYCSLVRVMTRTANKVLAKHIRKDHPEVPVVGLTNEQVVGQHYRTDVWTQRLFATRRGSRRFEVILPGGYVTDHSIDALSTQTASDKGIFPDGFEEWKIKSRTEANLAVPRVVKASDHDPSHADAWLGRVQWPAYFNGWDASTLLSMKPSSLAAGDPDLLFLQSSTMDFVMWCYGEASSLAARDSNAAILLNQRRIKDESRPANKPWLAPVKQASRRGYAAVFATVVIHFATTVNDPDRRRWVPSDMQMECFQALRSLMDRVMASYGTSKPLDFCITAETTRLFIDFSISLYNDDLFFGQGDSVIYSALGIEAFRSYGWAKARHSTKPIAALLSVARCIIMVQASMKSKSRSLPPPPSLNTSSERNCRDSVTESVACHVRRMVANFLVPERSSQGKASTISMWLETTLAYGLALANVDQPAGKISWSDDNGTISMGNVRFNMTDLTDFAHRLVFELQEAMAPLLLLASRELLLRKKEDGGPEGIPWGSIHDSEGLPGDPWLMMGQDLGDDNNFTPLPLIDRVGDSADLRKRWFDQEGDILRIRQEAFENYRVKMKIFLERLLICFHVLSGQPARSPEILGLRWRGEPSSSQTRNIFVKGREVYTVTRYHKAFALSGRQKVIYRLLPYEVGECLVWYLWLVLPFYRAVHTKVFDVNQASLNTYLFTDDYVLSFTDETPVQESSEERASCSDLPDLGDRAEQETNETIVAKTETRKESFLSSRVTDRIDDVESDEEFNDEDDGAEGDDSSAPLDRPGTGGTAFAVADDGSPEKLRWVDRTVSVVLGNLCSGYRLSGDISVSKWRHLSIAIARKHCAPFWAQPDSDPGVGLGNGYFELQGAHTKQTAEHHYGNQTGQLSMPSTLDREGFLAASRTWHRFLTLNHLDKWELTGTADGNSVLPRPPVLQADIIRRQSQSDRLNGLQTDILEGLFRAVYSPEGAGKTNHLSLRPPQRAVLDAICLAVPYIIYVAGTGSGKSLTYELPALFGNSGTTIVIVPLLTLQAYMHKGCLTRHIDAHVFSPGGFNPTSRLVFVTPEKFVMPSFTHYAMNLRNQCQLDRIIVDEAHTILDSHEDFRPCMRELPESIMNFKAQTVFMTATLPLTDETKLMSLASDAQTRTSFRVIRFPTRRPDTRYEVKLVANKADGVDEVVKLVKSLREKFIKLGRKLIIFAKSKSDAEMLAEKVICPFFHAGAGTREEQQREYERFADSEAGVMSCTSMMAQGLHTWLVGAIVIYRGLGKGARDLMQAAGRAGTGLQRCTATLVYCGDDRYDENNPSSDSQIYRIATEQQCRRLVIDHIMDGVERQLGQVCGVGEAPCDLCQPTWQCDYASVDDDHEDRNRAGAKAPSAITDHGDGDESDEFDEGDGKDDYTDSSAESGPLDDGQSNRRYAIEARSPSNSSIDSQKTQVEPRALLAAVKQSVGGAFESPPTSSHEAAEVLNSMNLPGVSSVEADESQSNVSERNEDGWAREQSSSRVLGRPDEMGTEDLSRAMARAMFLMMEMTRGAKAAGDTKHSSSSSTSNEAIPSRKRVRSPSRSPEIDALVGSAAYREGTGYCHSRASCDDSTRPQKAPRCTRSNASPKTPSSCRGGVLSLPSPAAQSQYTGYRPEPTRAACRSLIPPKTRAHQTIASSSPPAPPTANDGDYDTDFNQSVSSAALSHYQRTPQRSKRTHSAASPFAPSASSPPNAQSSSQRSSSSTHLAQSQHVLSHRAKAAEKAKEDRNAEHVDFKSLIEKCKKGCFACLARHGQFIYHDGRPCIGSVQGYDLTDREKHIASIESDANELRRKVLHHFPNGNAFRGCLRCYRPQPDCESWVPRTTQGSEGLYSLHNEGFRCIMDGHLVWTVFIALLRYAGYRANPTLSAYINGSSGHAQQNAPLVEFDDQGVLQNNHFHKWAAIKRRWPGNRAETFNLNAASLFLYRKFILPRLQC